MIDKSIYICLAVYIMSFSILTIQYAFADVFNITLTGVDGTPLRSNILVLLNTDTINTLTGDIVSANNTRNDTLSAIENAYNIGFNVGWDIITLLTGTYIFGVLYLMGVPVIMIAGMVAVYAFFLARTIIALIRGL